MSAKNKFELGGRIRDRVSGFTGIATARIEYLNGCVQYQVDPPMDKDKGEPPKSIWVDSQQAEYVDEGINDKPVLRKMTGGPGPSVAPGYKTP